MASLKFACIAGLLALGSAGPVWADEAVLDGGWMGRSESVAQSSDVVIERDHAVPVLTTATLPPRRPKVLASAAPRPARAVAVVSQPPVLRIAAVQPQAKPVPLFWMTVGNGF